MTPGDAGTGRRASRAPRRSVTPSGRHAKTITWQSLPGSSRVGASRFRFARRGDSKALPVVRCARSALHGVESQFDRNVNGQAGGWPLTGRGVSRAQTVELEPSRWKRATGTKAVAGKAAKGTRAHSGGDTMR